MALFIVHSGRPYRGHYEKAKAQPTYETNVTKRTGARQRR